MGWKSVELVLFLAVSRSYYSKISKQVVFRDQKRWRAPSVCKEEKVSGNDCGSLWRFLLSKRRAIESSLCYTNRESWGIISWFARGLSTRAENITLDYVNCLSSCQMLSTCSTFLTLRREEEKRSSEICELELDSGSRNLTWSIQISQASEVSFILLSLIRQKSLQPLCLQVVHDGNHVWRAKA